MSKNALRDFLMLSRVDSTTHNSIWELREHGVDFDKLLALVAPAKRGRPRKTKTLASPKKRGAPITSPILMPALDDIVRGFRELGRTDTDRAAIRLLVIEYVRDCRGNRMHSYLASLPTRPGETMTLDRLVRSLQCRLSRHRAALQKSAQK